MKFILFFVIYFYLGRVGNGQLSNGDNCENNKGKCIILKDCPSAMLSLQNGTYPETCGFEKNQPLVCCPTSERLKEENISSKKCKSYSRPAGLFDPTIQVFGIIGGTDSTAKEFPHMAALGFINGNNIEWLCGGSIVSDQFILTAAHCLTSREFGTVEWVRLGDINLTPSSSSDGTSQDFRIKRRIPHPSYKSPSVYNDIALLELDGRIQFNEFIKPACLYQNRAIPPNLELIATGWGVTEFGGSKSNILQKVDLDLFTDAECKKSYSNESARRMKDGIVSDMQICAGGRQTEKDACQGDSGGPLQAYNFENRIFTIIGITSFGKACGSPNVPGVYTRVSYYVPWLEKIIWPNN